MPRVQLTPHLRRYFPDLEDAEVAGATVAEIVQALERRHPGLAGYIVDDRGALRKHVNIFVGEARVRDRERLSDAVGADEQIFILQALSGG